MKYLLFVLLSACLIFSGVVPEAQAFEGINMEELLKKAEEGDVEAMTQLGVAYMKGTGVKRDKVKGAELYQKAADKGYDQAQWNLAFAYLNGRGVNEDYNEAARYMKMAAEQGYPPAQYDLGMMYLQGIGVQRSRTAAIDWIVKASDQGYKEADAFLTSRGIEKVKPAEKVAEKEKKD
jgi:TPR repeat protein